MRRIVLAVIGAASLLGALCCGPAPESCSGKNTCAKGGTWEACCTSTQCRYVLSDGTSIACNGTDCASGNPSAAKRTADWCATH